MAVGSYTTLRSTQPLVERSVGAAWSVVRFRWRARFGSLSGVSCVTAGVCTVIGEGTRPFAARSVRRGWRICRLPGPLLTNSLSGVSCASSSNCVVVGHTVSRSGGDISLAERWQHGRWSMQRTPNPRASTPDPAPLVEVALTAVSCTSPRSCVATGYSQAVDNPGGKGHPVHYYYRVVIERFDGRRWIAEQAPSPSGPGPLRDQFGLSGVSCAAAGTCVAVGANGNGTLGLGDVLSVTFAEQLLRGRWGLMASADAAGSLLSRLRGVSCPSTSECFAVGDAVLGFDPVGAGYWTEPLILRWAGGRWTVVPGPAAALVGELTGISCGSATRCVAVGGAPSTSGDATQPLIEAWNGSDWSLEVTPPLSGSQGLLGVSCTSDSFCVAVGSGLAEVYRGGAWSAQSIPALLDAVSCTTSVACTAVGASGSPGHHTLAERWDGTGFTAQSTADPSGTTWTGLNSVSCPAIDACIAVGYYTTGPDPGLRERTLAERWDGTSWSRQSTPNPSGTGLVSPGAQLNSISCWATDACETAGTFDSMTVAGTVLSSLTYRWNGFGWAVQDNPGAADLSSVWCSSADMCTALGSALGSAAVGSPPVAMGFA
jgi:hypothetical protein